MGNWRHAFRLATGVFVIALAASPVEAQPASAERHRGFDQLLSRHVADSVVDYAAFSEQASFTDYVQSLGDLDPEALVDPQENLAFWINAYNAFAIQGILDGQSPSTFFGRIGYFKTTEYRAVGRNIDLYDLEHDELMILGEPRIHFAIVCASLSCPALRSEAYDTSRLEQQLEDQARAFINDPSRNHFDREQKIAHLSKIFQWYADDFGGTDAVLDFISGYVADPGLARELAEGEYQIHHLDYDWSLNGKPPK